MNNITLKENLQKYPYLKTLIKYFLIISKEEHQEIKNSEVININNTTIPIKLLENILNDETYYNYTIHFFNNEINTFKVCYIQNGDTAGHLTYSKLTIINGLISLINNKQISLTNITKSRYETLINLISFNNFQKNNIAKSYNTTIDNISYNIAISNFLEIIQLPPQKFNNLCVNSNIQTLYNIPKLHFMYALNNYIKEYHLLENYILPPSIITNYQTLNNMQLIDFESLNYHLTPHHEIIKNIKLNKDLTKVILYQLPKNTNNLEKAIYIYLKLCKTLTYDEEYYAANQTGPAAKKHQTIKKITSISPQHNSVVCFELNLIFAKFLHDLNINFTTDDLTNYGYEHTNLEFRYEKFLIRADSVTSILNGDLTKAKLNQPLTGLTCINTNKSTQQEFLQTLDKIYNLIISQENNHLNLFELLTEYTNLTNNIKKINLQEKLSIIIEKANSTTLQGIDLFSYILQLKKIIFNKIELNNNFTITIIRDNTQQNTPKIVIPCAIIAINEQNFEIHPQETKYYYFTPQNSLIPISQETIQNNFNNQMYEYISNNSPTIPGINELNHGGYKR